MQLKQEDVRIYKHKQKEGYCLQWHIFTFKSMPEDYKYHHTAVALLSIARNEQYGNKYFQDKNIYPITLYTSSHG